ncbi:MAG: MATE family efflux transporter [Rhodobacterales bacterium]|nr:MAG: MATE family efflux transporter [Rhodobacterales bacterium]
MAVVMSTGGLLNVVDGIFVGRFVGADALAAISLAFPIVMVLTALTTLVGGGMASLFTRHLGATNREAAGAVFAGAHGLVLAVSACLAVGAYAFGDMALAWLSTGNRDVAGLARDYLAILLLGAPIQFALGLHGDALRSEGKAGVIALLSVLVNFFNIAANYVAIVVFDLGIAGSAIGTVAAQALGFGLALMVRGRSPSLLPLRLILSTSWLRHWRQILGLGLPLCLSFVGMALVSTIVLRAIGTQSADPATDVAGYGVVTRILGFAFLPQLAFALTVQTITGTNVGAGLPDRALAALKLGMGCAFLWCLGVTLAGVVAGEAIGALFSDDLAVAQATGRIMTIITLLYAANGPILVLAMHFQAMGHPVRTAVLTLAKPWLLTPALIAALSARFGADGIWAAFPCADAVLLALALTIGFRGDLAPAQNSATIGETK